MHSVGARIYRCGASVRPMAMRYDAKRVQVCQRRSTDWCPMCANRLRSCRCCRRCCCCCCCRQRQRRCWFVSSEVDSDNDGDGDACDDVDDDDDVNCASASTETARVPCEGVVASRRCQSFNFSRRCSPSALSPFVQGTRLVHSGPYQLIGLSAYRANGSAHRNLVDVFAATKRNLRSHPAHLAKAPLIYDPSGWLAYYRQSYGLDIDPIQAHVSGFSP